jgi:gas vesicle protein
MEKLSKEELDELINMEIITEENLELQRLQKHVDELKRCVKEDCDFYLEHNEVYELNNYIENLQSQLKEIKEAIKEVRETIQTKLEKSFAYDYGLSGVDATSKDRLFTETVIELQLIDKLLSRGDTDGNKRTR